MCFLTRSFSDLEPLERLTGGETTQGHVGPASVIDPEIAGLPLISLLRGLEGHAVGPLLQQGADESLCLAVGLGCVRPAAYGLEIEGPAGFSPVSGSVGGAVVAEDPLAGDPLHGEPAHRAGQKAHGGGLLLVGQHLNVGFPVKATPPAGRGSRPAPAAFASPISSITFHRHTGLVSLPRPPRRRPPTFFGAPARPPPPPGPSPCAAAPS